MGSSGVRFRVPVEVADSGVVALAGFQAVAAASAVVARAEAGRTIAGNNRKKPGAGIIPAP